MNRWRAEWNVLSEMKVRGDFEDSLKRIQKLLNPAAVKQLAPELQLRLLWLNIQLSVDFDKVQEVPRLADELLALLNAHPSEQAEQLASHTLLLKAQALIRLNEIEEGFHWMRYIRERYPSSKAAILSYISEARYYTQSDRTAEAQQKLIHLSDHYPNSEYVPIALYEAAMNAEARELASTYQEALVILERLVTDYSSSPLVFYARLKQGDILRKMNDFSAAQLVYENLLHQNLNHPERYRAELARADCILARAGKDIVRLKEAAAEYERLMDLPTVPAEYRLEAGYKAGLALLKGLEVERAREVYWSQVTQFLLQAHPTIDFGVQGHYWLARSMFELASSFEVQGNFAQAREVYQLVDQYQLPGQNLAQRKLN